MTEADHLVGCLWGTALGDALGLCREGLSRSRGQKMYPNLDRYQLFGGRGWVSDDTEHAAFTVWALQQPDRFESRLRQALRRWLWCLPAGVGLATLRAGLKASLGFRQCGVYSAGNGPLMRAPVLAVGSGERWREHVEISTRLTHTDPRALQGALLVAQVTRYLLGRIGWNEVAESLDDNYLKEKLQQMGEHPSQSPQEYAREQGWEKGISGFVYHTAPLVVEAVLYYRDDYGQAVRSVIECGGDTDTTAAIVGGMLGARLGKVALPDAWVKQFGDRPHSLDYLEKLARGQLQDLPGLPLCLARNLIFGWVILGYGFRRLLPPY